MKNKTDNYFADISRLLVSIKVTDRKGRPLALSTGLDQAVALILDRTGLGNKLIFIGNGASASIASHQSTDFWKNGGMRAIAFNDSSLLTTVSNDFGYHCVFEKPVAMFADKGDILMAISSSGQSENILRGVKAARRKGCRVITLSGLKVRNPLRSAGEINFYVPSDSYGYVEICHLAICHCILDSAILKKGSLREARSATRQSRS